MTSEGRIFIIGIDGATFRVIEPLVRQGLLPNLKKMMDEGVSSPMLSTIPPLSPVAWTTISTGVNPARHGIIDFLAYDKHEKKTVFFDSSFRRVKPVWTVLSETGKRTCVVNVPMTFPVDRLNGFMISGLGTPPTNEGYAYPMDAYNEMAGAAGGYKIDIDVREDRFDFADLKKSIEDVMDARLRSLDFLLKKERWDFFMFVFTMTDRAQHFFWQFFDPGHPLYSPSQAEKFADTVRRSYEKADEGIGRVLACADEKDTVIVVSDHGFGPLTKDFSLSRWLHENGYLHVDPKVSGKSRTGVVASLKRKVPTSVVHFLVRNVFKESMRHHKALSSGVNEAIIWEKTKVYSNKRTGSIFLYFNDGTVQADERGGLKKELSEKLLAVRDPDTGAPVFKEVLDGESLYGATTSPVTPDLVLEPDPKYSISFRLAGLDDLPVFSDSAVWSGNHDPEGIFIIRGPSTKKGIRMHGTTIADVTPTVYYLSGIPIPSSLDGRILKECLSEEFLMQNKELSTDKDVSVATDDGSLTKEETEEVMKSLKGLGYM